MKFENCLVHHLREFISYMNKERQYCDTNDIFVFGRKQFPIYRFLDYLHTWHHVPSRLEGTVRNYEELIDDIFTHKRFVFDAGNDIISFLTTLDNIDEYLNTHYSDLIFELDRRLFMHDASKFSAIEFEASLDYLFNSENSVEATENKATGIIYHYYYNDHHPEYYTGLTHANAERLIHSSVNFQSFLTPKTNDFSVGAVAEMIADWRGASKQYGGDLDTWWLSSKNRWRFSEETKNLITLISDNQFTF